MIKLVWRYLKLASYPGINDRLGLSMAFCISVVITLLHGDPSFANSDAPVKSINATFEKPEPEQLAEKLAQFSKKYGWSFTVRQTRPDKQYIIIEITRDPLEVIVLDSFKPESFDIFIYSHGNAAGDSGVVDSLARRLEALIEEIPGAKISDPAELNSSD